MSDDPVSACQECGAPVERVFHPVAVHFKGSGFYTTDYARKAAAKASERRRLGLQESKDRRTPRTRSDGQAGRRRPAASSAKKDD